MRIGQLFMFAAERPLGAIGVEGSGLADAIETRILREVCPKLGDRLLECIDPDHFVIVLEEMLSDRSVARAYACFTEIMMDLPFDPPSGELHVRPEVTRLLGDGAARCLQELLDDMAEHEDLISVMMTVQRTDLRQQTIAQANMPRLDWFVTDDRLPLECRKMMFQRVTGEICVMAIAVVVAQERRTLEWLGLLLAERFRDGQRAYIQFLLEMMDAAESKLDYQEQAHVEALRAWKCSVLCHYEGGNLITAPFAGSRDGR